ncbi:MAG: Jag N-terminal domain-containing protein [Candidatus Omnitrophica bacterium]|nr:Jag N-terminal domain-containing protein [Candidatus Omnitrophota bacterium]
MTPKHIEIEGRTVEEAIKKALKELKMPRERLKVEILTDEQKGLFGMPGAKLAKIRVSILRNKESA